MECRFSQLHCIFQVTTTPTTTTTTVSFLSSMPSSCLYKLILSLSSFIFSRSPPPRKPSKTQCVHPNVQKDGCSTVTCVMRWGFRNFRILRIPISRSCTEPVAIIHSWMSVISVELSWWTWGTGITMKLWEVRIRIRDSKASESGYFQKPSAQTAKSLKKHGWQPMDMQT